MKYTEDNQTNSSHPLKINLNPSPHTPSSTKRKQNQKTNPHSSLGSFLMKKDLYLLANLSRGCEMVSKGQASCYWFIPCSSNQIFYMIVFLSFVNK